MGLEQHQQLKLRTKAFALRIIRMTQALPRNRKADVLARQVLRSATSIAANYRAAGRGRSKAEFTAKLGIVIEEADETVLWLELLAESGTAKAARLSDLHDEGNQLLAILHSFVENAQAINNLDSPQTGSSDFSMTRCADDPIWFTSFAAVPASPSCSPAFSAREQRPAGQHRRERSDSTP